MIFKIRKQQETLEQLIDNVKDVCKDGYKLLAKLDGMDYKVQCKQVHWQVHGKFYYPYIVEVYVNSDLVKSEIKIDGSWQNWIKVYKN